MEEIQSHYKTFYEKLANLKENIQNKKDPLDFLFELTITPLKNKIVVWILTLIFCIFSFAFYLTSFRLLSIFDTDVLMKHGSVWGVEFFILINFGIVLVNRKEMIEFNDAFKNVTLPINEDFVEPNDYKKIMLKVKLLKFTVFLNYVLSFAAIFGLITSPEFLKSNICLEDWILNNIPEYSEIIIFVFHSTFFPVSLLVVSFSVYTGYIAFSCMFQIVLINGAIRNICDSTIPPMERYDSDYYQELVDQKLQIIILFQNLCFKILMVGRDLTYIPIIFFAIGAVILAGSLLLEVFANDVVQMDHFYGLICSGLNCAISTSLCIVSGQFLKNESERTFSLLVQVPWYYMNVKNRRLYTIILMMLQKPLSISNGLIEVNYVLFLQIVKTIYSLAALLFQFVDKAKIETF